MSHVDTDPSGRAQPHQKFRRPVVATCLSCGEKLPAHARTGRPRNYCSNRCRGKTRRDKKAVQRLKNDSGPGTPDTPQNSENSLAVSASCGSKNRGRGSANGLWLRVIPTEVIDAHDWTEAVSSDGVVSYIAVLRARALRDNGGAA
jgi:hypothetical protein